jgi:hypothetical protein
VEKIEKRSRADAIARYVREHPEGGHWADWLLDQRIELNAMTTPDFIAWLDAKMQQHGAAKVVPPAAAVGAEMAARLADHTRRIVTERILRETRVDEQVAAALRSLTVPGDVELRAGVVAWLQGHRDSAWRDYIDGLARSSADRRPSLR